MEVRLPSEYDAEEITRALNQVLTQLEEKTNNAKIVDKITTSGSEPPDINEREIRIRRLEDGTGTKKLIIRDEGSLYEVTLTKI